MGTKRDRNQRTLSRTVLMVVGLVIISAVWFAAAGGDKKVTGQAAAPEVRAEGTPHFLSIVRLDPTPTATSVPALPELVSHVVLDEAQCPNDVEFNPYSGYTYVVNNFSSNVGVFVGEGFVGYIETGTWPSGIAAVPDSPRVYVANLHTEVVAVDGLTVTGHIPDYYEPYDVTYNPVNGYAYVSDLKSTVQIIDGTTLLKNLELTDSETGQPAGWLRPIVADPTTGLVYVASWEYGKLYVIDGLDVVSSHRVGWGPLNMALDAERGYLYIAHSDPNETYSHNLSVYSLADGTVTYLSTAVRSRDVTVDPITGIAYASNPDDDTVTVLQGTTVLANLPAGQQPWGVGVNPNTGYIFVANRGDGSVSVYKDGDLATTIETPGMEPFAVGVDTNQNYVYIANRGDEYDLFQCAHASVTILR